MKFLLHFVATAFYSCRVRIGIMYAEGTPPTDLDATGDIPSRIIDIKGSTTVQLYVPYLSSKMWEFTNPQFVGTEVARIFIVALTNVVGSNSPSTASMYLNIWRSGAEDIQFCYPQSAQRLDGDDGIYFFESLNSEERQLMFPKMKLTGQSHVHVHKKRPRTKVEHQMDVRKYFSSPFCSCIDFTKYTIERGFVSGEGNYSIIDMCRRPSEFTYYANYLLGVPYYPGDNNGSLTPKCNRELLSYFAAMFLGWRGSRVFQSFDPSKGQTRGNGQSGYGMAFTPVAGTSLASEATLYAHMSSGLQIFNTDGDLPMNKVTMPYYCTQPYRLTFFSEEDPTDIAADEDPDDLYYWSTDTSLTPGLMPGFDSANNPPHFGYATMAAGDDFMYLYLKSPSITIRPSSKETKNSKSTANSTSSSKKC